MTATADRKMVESMEDYPEAQRSYKGTHNGTFLKENGMPKDFPKAQKAHKGIRAPVYIAPPVFQNTIP